MKRFIVAALLALPVFSQAQQDSSSSSLKISAYLETYAAYDFAKPENHTRPSFVYSFNRTGELNLNLAMVKLAWQTEQLRSVLALGTGTYMNANLAAEPGVLKNIFEASIGMKLSPKKNLWLDAGIFPSHIGFESAIGKDNATLTRSMAADNSPYYETGTKVTYATDNGKWQLSALLLNGWQRIQRPAGNHTPAFGHQLVFTPKSGVTLNSSSFIGNDRPDSTRRMRYFHNLYGIFDLGKSIQLTTGFDIGMEQKEKASRSFHRWYTPVAIVRWKIKEGHWLAARAEQYSDRGEVIVSTPQGFGFETWSFGLNYDMAIFERMLWRTEIRSFSGRDDYFGSAAKPSSRNTVITSSLSIFFP